MKIDTRALIHRAPPHPDPDDHDLPERLAKWPPLPRYLVAELERSGNSRERAAGIVRAAWHNAGGTHA